MSETRPRGRTVTQSLYAEAHEPLMKFWRLCIVTNERYGAGLESLNIRNDRKVLSIRLEKFLLKKEQLELAKIIDDHHGVELDLTHAETYLLTTFCLQVAIRIGLTIDTIQVEVYERNPTEGQKLIDQYNELLAEKRSEVDQKKKAKAKEKRAGESSKTGAAS